VRMTMAGPSYEMQLIESIFIAVFATGQDVAGVKSWILKGISCQHREHLCVLDMMVDIYNSTDLGFAAVAVSPIGLPVVRGIESV
jgi:hypothetical protein